MDDSQRPQIGLNRQAMMARHTSHTAVTQLSHETADGSGVCGMCPLLGLSLDKFNRSESNELEHTQSDFGGQEAVVAQEFQLEDLYFSSKGCLLCNFLFRSIEQNILESHRGTYSMQDIWSSPRGSNTIIRLDWQLDGRASVHDDPSGFVLTRRLRVLSKDNDFQPFYLIPFRPGAACDQPSFQARSVQPAQAELTQMRNWIDLCTSNHEKCSKSIPDPSGISPLRLIDVVSRCLVEMQILPRFCTLSYCWGGNQQTTLKMSNMEEYQSQLPFERLPKTIRDAIRLVQDLNERYLWVDALCIVQDDRNDWARVAPQMDKIYGTSILTICAASGADSNYGLPGSAPGSRRLGQIVGSFHNLKMLAYKPLENRVSHAPWNDRAWVFQERLLSRRCLIFVDDRVYFQCRNATWSEELDCENPCLFWTLDTADSPLNSYHDNPLRRYTKFVNMYSSRVLTFDSDRLVAFEGIASSLTSDLHRQTSMPSEAFYYGLPSWYFDWALLWEKAVAGNKTNERVPTDSRRHFPTWSWCGWKGASEWRMSTTSSVLFNLHEWLAEHTWIIWYITTDREPRRLVYAIDQSASAQMRHSRWDGYGRHDKTSVEGNLRAYDDSYGRLSETQPNLPTVPTQFAREGALQFFSWSACFSLSSTVRSEESFRTTLAQGLQRFSILDSKRDWCGTIILDTSYLDEQRLSYKDGSRYKFIAISEARDFSMEEYDTWTYYIPSERDQSEWYLYYALMVRSVDQEGSAAKCYERLGLAKIYQAAFKAGSLQPGCMWREFILI